MHRTEIVFVRHGQTHSNLAGLLHGRTDALLNSRGLWQVERVAVRLGQMSPLQSIHSSPLSRALVTAQAISNRTGTTIRLHHDLVEFHFGDFEGLTVSQIEASYPEIYSRMFDFNDLEFRFPNGESRGEFHLRALTAVNRIIGQHIGHRFAIVAHEGVISSAVAQLTGRDPFDWTKNRLDNCSITTLEMNGANVAAITCWNDIQHLAESGADR